MNQIQDMQA